MHFLTDEAVDPNPPDFPYYACDTCGWFHRDGKPCTGRPGYCRLGYEGLRVFRSGAKRAWSELRAEWRQEKPGLKAEFEAGWRDMVKDVEAYMKRTGKKEKGGGGVKGEGGGEE